MPLFGAAYAAPNKGTTILYWFRSQKLLNPPVSGKIQGLFKAFECFSSTFVGKFNFQGLFMTVLYIQVTGTFQACANPKNTFIVEANNMDPNQTGAVWSDWSSLIWVHVVCNIGYHSPWADEKADEFIWECWKGS